MKLHAFLATMALHVLPLAAQEGDYERLLEMKSRRKVVIRANAENATAGRNTLTGDQIRNAPATFGDSLNALTTLPLFPGRKSHLAARRTCDTDPAEFWCRSALLAPGEEK
ncbi:MAG: hypothetical protein ACOY5B_07250 [Spirochaetota bacterium]